MKTIEELQRENKDLAKQLRKTKREANEWKHKYHSMDALANRMMDENELLHEKTVRLLEQLDEANKQRGFEKTLRLSLDFLADAMVMVEPISRKSKNKKTIDGWLRLRHAKDEIRWVGSFLIPHLTDPSLYNSAV